MTNPNQLRLLPWSGPDGKPCYLSTDDSNSHLSRLADYTEAVQLGIAAQLLEHADDVLDGGVPTETELSRLVVDLTATLRSSLRVAVSRGHRLSLATPSITKVGDEGPPNPLG
ncbi:hypothetical protein ACIPW9_26155 [Streptomyces sp. NPDC090052]|uniref:hypothetical protein n=1 Tax=Streptomyces sp. NPDC090052 TaxID=3365931 RepID=UPI0038012CBE